MWAKTRETATQHLKMELRKMPSLYQLMPPANLAYIKHWNSNRIVNPLQASEAVLSATFKARAAKVHNEIANAVESVDLRGRFHVFYGDTTATENFYNVSVSNENGQPFYRVDGDPAMIPGDGTVLVDSATYGDRLRIKAQLHPYPVKHNQICENGRVLEKLQTLL